MSDGGGIEINGRGPLNDVQVLRWSIVDRSVLRVAAERGCLRRNICWSDKQEAAKYSGKEEPASILFNQNRMNDTKKQVSTHRQ